MIRIAISAAAFAEAERDRIRERIGQVKADGKRTVPRCTPRSWTVMARLLSQPPALGRSASL
jgi:hypothetical protein